VNPSVRFGLLAVVLSLGAAGCLPEVDFTPCTLRDTCPVEDVADADAPAVDACLDATLCGDAGGTDVAAEAAIDVLADQSAVFDALDAMEETSADASDASDVTVQQDATDGDVADVRDVAPEASIVDTGPCPAMFSLCDGTCVDTLSNRLHCGGCGRACTGGQSCAAGVCVCPAMFTLCGGTCVDTRNDRANCGACAQSCQFGMSCTAGACVCPSGLTYCGPDCNNLLNDDFNCGFCGNDCTFRRQTCSAGACVCAPGFTLCRGFPDSCYDLQTNVRNCGACGNACATGLTCRRGACVTP
jgi:hypothetical protein